MFEKYRNQFYESLDSKLTSRLQQILIVTIQSRESGCENTLATRFARYKL